MSRARASGLRAALPGLALIVGGAFVAFVPDAQGGTAAERGLGAAPTPPTAASASSADAVLQRMRATYAALRSYSDIGTVLTEDQSIGGQLVVEQHRFTTAYRAPRHFVFDFAEDPNAGADRFVVWCAGESFQTWWLSTRVHETYPQGQGATAFAVAAHPTRGSVLLVPALLFASARLQGPLATMHSVRHAGTEPIDGRPMHKLVADVRVNHWSEATRPTTVFIDAATYLVRRIVEDTQKDGSSGVVQRSTTTFEPRADPPLDDARFRFAPPK